MVWSEQVGVSIVVPSDRVDGDGRNYIVIGEDVPAEIAGRFTAALVFRAGLPDTVGSGNSGYNYFALGISTGGELEVVAYVWYDPSAGAGIGNQFYQYKRQTLLQFAPPSGSDQPLAISVGGGGGSAYNEWPYGVSVANAGAPGDVSNWTNLVLQSPYVAGSEGAVYRIKNGVLYFAIHVLRSPATTNPANAIVAYLPVPPARSHFFYSVFGNVPSEISFKTDGIVRNTFANSQVGVLVYGSYPL